MSKELETFERIKLALAKHLSEDTGVSVEKHLEYLENDTDIMNVEQALTELEELKATVKELLNIPITVSTFSDTSLLIKTMNKLEKLVGDKDE